MGTRPGGTEAKKKKKTEDDHRQDINDPWVLGTRLGGTEAKKTEDERTTTTDTQVKETIARDQVGNGEMMSDQPRKMITKIWGEDGRDEEKEDKGAGLSAKMEDEGAGRKDDVYKDEGAGLSPKMEDEGGKMTWTRERG